MIGLEDLAYELPPERIAQEPARPRDRSRVLILERASGRLAECEFRDLSQRIPARDLVVVNDTQVWPARLRGHKRSGGRAEALMLERQPKGRWRALLRCSGRLREGLRVELGGVDFEVERILGDGSCVLRSEGDYDLETLLQRIGEAPLPPYIRRPEPRPRDLEDYQSIFAKRPGSVAAPTASLHFTSELAARLRIARVTLHVGPGTFRPLRSPRLDGHVLEAERFRVPAATSRAIRLTRADGARVIAVGTTVVRALESTGGEPGEGSTDLLIRPGHRFVALDSLITNFHLPRSSLLLLVMAFAGVEPVREAYAHALAKGFRFCSYGDAMWIL